MTAPLIQIRSDIEPVKKLQRSKGGILHGRGGVNEVTIRGRGGGIDPLWPSGAGEIAD